MKKLLKITLTSLAAVSLLAGCGEQPGPDKPDDPTPIEPTEIKVESVSLNKTELSLYINDSEFLIATIAPENATKKGLIWSSSNDDIAMVSATGKVKGLSVGTATITATSEENNQKFAECVVTVSKKDTTVHVESVSLDKHELALYDGESGQINATIAPENATEKGLTWSSSNERVAFVSNGKIAAVGVGETTIKVASVENPAKFDECVVTVTKKDTTIHVTSVSVAEDSFELDLGATYTAKPTLTVLPEDATNKKVNWTSSDPSKVLVDSSTGAITGIAVTEEAVTITAASDENSSIKDTLTVTVKDTTDHDIHPESVSLPETLQLDMNGGNVTTINATVLPEKAGNKKVTWTVSPLDVISVESLGDTTGKVTALKTGEAVITATTEDGGLVDTCTVTVVDTKVYVNNVVIKHDNESVSELDINIGSFASVSASCLGEGGVAADNQGITWEIAEADKEFVRLNVVEGNSQVIFVDKLADHAITVKAVSKENSEKYAELSITTVDPTIYPNSVAITVDNVVTESTNIEVGANLSINAKVLALDPSQEVTNPKVKWTYVTDSGNTFVNISDDEANTITISGLKSTGDDFVTLRATAVGKESVYSEIKIKVINPKDVDRFVNFIEPTNITKFKAHIDASALNDVDGLCNNADNPKGQFYKYADADQDKMVYKVGDQGKFIFNPSASIKKAGEDNETTITDVSYDKKLAVYNSSTSEYEEVTMSDYVTVNGNEFTFKAAAVGKKFKLIYSPDSTYYVKDPSTKAKEFIFDVIHGYNVYTLAELSLFDNFQSCWTAYKNANGLEGVVAQGGIILHRDIAIDSSILPSNLIWTPEEVNNYVSGTGKTDFEEYVQAIKSYEAAALEEFKNSIKDYSTIFERNANNEDFTFEGNFFTVDASKTKKVIMMDPVEGEQTLINGLKGDGSHAQLFGINCMDADRPSGDTIHNVTMRNFQLSANGSLNGGILAKGGLIGVKFDGCDFNLENAIITQAFTGVLSQDYSANQGRASMHADRITAYDFYSSAFYIYGTQNNYLTNSWCSRCGGPLVILDECQNRKANNYASNPNVTEASFYAQMDCTNTYLDNPVTGTEPWFNGHEGAAGMIQGNIIDPGLESGFFGAASKTDYQAGKGNGKTISTKLNESEKYCNFIAIDINAHKFATNNLYEMGGHFYIHNNGEESLMDMKKVEKKIYNIGQEVPIAKPFWEYTDEMYKDMGQWANIPNFVAPMLFESSIGGLGYLAGDGATFVDPLETLNPAAAGAVFAGNYMSIYLDAMIQASVMNGKYLGVTLGTYDIPSKTK